MVGLDPVPLVATTLGRGPVSALAGVVGLLIGSFLNVVVYRVPLHLSVVEPRSFCPQCQTPLRSVDNVPLVSWVVLGRRCRHCRAPIPVRYPLVELATGVVFAVVGLFYYMQVARSTFMSEGDSAEPIVASLPLRASIAICLVAVVGLGLWPNPLFAESLRAAGSFWGH